MPAWRSLHLDRRRLGEEADAVVDQGDVSALRDGESKADGGKYEEVRFLAQEQPMDKFRMIFSNVDSRNTNGIDEK